MQLPRRVRAVVFDMDGLLVDTEQLVFAAMQAQAAEWGRDMPFDLFKQMIGLSHVHSDRIAAEYFGDLFDLEAWRTGVGAHFHAAAAAGIALKTGVLELLDELDARGLPRAIATSSSRDALEHSLGQHGLLERFDAFITRDVQTNHKPHPEPYLTAAAAIGVDPADCLALEDSHNGVRAAAAAGMMTVMVPDLLEATDEMRGLALHIVEDLHAVRAMLAAQAA